MTNATEITQQPEPEKATLQHLTKNQTRLVAGLLVGMIAATFFFSAPSKKQELQIEMLVGYQTCVASVFEKNINVEKCTGLFTLYGDFPTFLPDSLNDKDMNRLFEKLAEERPDAFSDISAVTNGAARQLSSGKVVMVKDNWWNAIKTASEI
ncbi:hypothetical protein [Enterovibrio norvegicus]|uniref:hypothetical protein n=1 Tax=Enterovibrio norvegicus TaxID=188144 RepID=UPI00352F0632